MILRYIVIVGLLLLAAQEIETHIIQPIEQVEISK